SNFHNMLLSNDFDSIDVEVVKSSRTRLSEINTQLLGHLLAQEKDADQELAKNEEYAEKTGAILSSHPNADVTPKQGNSSSLGKIKLPAIVAKDPASWIKFRMLLESAPGFKTATDDEKKAQRSEEHTSELQSRFDLVCRLLLEKKKQRQQISREKRDVQKVHNTE